MPAKLDHLSYCGLYCGKCYLLQDNIPDQVHALLKKFKEIQFEKWAKGLAEVNPEMKAFAEVDACYRVLEAWQVMRCSAACRQGGGSANCEIRNCCRSKNLDGCWRCPELEKCGKLVKLHTVNGDLNYSNIKYIKEHGVEDFIAHVTSRLGLSFYRE
ncbi:DUF3795 domain-containing protein [candidate division FCPU426 bacterium]|nr:DUF3795 domain-containing protein [candidate division FCPU426 bacterium]